MKHPRKTVKLDGYLTSLQLWEKLEVSGCNVPRGSLGWWVRDSFVSPPTGRTKGSKYPTIALGEAAIAWSLSQLGEKGLISLNISTEGVRQARKFVLGLLQNPMQIWRWSELQFQDKENPGASFMPLATLLEESEKRAQKRQGETLVRAWQGRSKVFFGRTRIDHEILETALFSFFAVLGGFQWDQPISLRFSMPPPENWDGDYTAIDMDASLPLRFAVITPKEKGESSLFPFPSVSLDSPPVMEEQSSLVLWKPGFLFEEE